jgi:hypothetical protein
MFRIALIAALTIAATPALAGTIGHDFCTVMQQQHIACTKEAAVKTAGGSVTGRCPVAIEAETTAYKSAIAAATGDLKAEIERANAQWNDIVANIMPMPGESKDAFMERNSEARHTVLSECAKLRALD